MNLIKLSLFILLILFITPIHGYACGSENNACSHKDSKYSSDGKSCESNKEEYSCTDCFGKIKNLVGKWEGTLSNSDKNEAVSVVYELTSGGTALIEKHFPGTPNEMVTVYYNDSGKLNMTHYCVLGNQPQMKLTSQSGNKLFFDYAGGSNIKTDKDPHMHSLVITMVDENNIVQDWSMYEDGNKKSGTTVKLKRVN
ncbi:MAG: hypothetical protein GTO02_07355 [Candidatus Dadabacteria bacterium]|nr:hypothetical protein [Candidatus Dadabacteria bacterium]NIQ14212.1 hypothetical protein [Candidatus Dadabacteria bacterium]